jgi:hypothetical protein
MAPPKTVAFSQELGLKVLYSNTVATAPRKPFLREAKEYLGGLQQLYIRILGRRAANRARGSHRIQLCVAWGIYLR